MGSGAASNPPNPGGRAFQGAFCLIESIGLLSCGNLRKTKPAAAKAPAVPPTKVSNLLFGVVGQLSRC